MKYVGKVVLKIVCDIFLMGCGVLTVCAYFADIEDVLEHGFD